MKIGNDLVFFSKPAVSANPLRRVRLAAESGPDWWRTDSFYGLMIGTPVYGQQSYLDHQLSVLQLALALQHAGVPAELVVRANDSLVPRARNAIVATFMASNYSHLLMVDADGGFEVEAVLRLLDANKPLVCGAVPLKRSELTFNVQWMADKPRDPYSDAVEVYGCGAAFMLAHRGVFATISEKYPNLKCRGADCLSEAEQAQHHCWFDTEQRDGGYLSEDLAFCHRYISAGGKVWVLPGLEMRHHGSHAYNGTLRVEALA